MQDWEEKRKVRRFLYSKTVLLILFLFIFLVTKGTYNLYQKSSEAHIKKNLLDKQLQELKGRQEFLMVGLKQLNSESGVETIIRQKFDVKKPGEEVAVIIAPKEKDDMTGEGNLSSFLQRFFTGFVDIFR